MQSLDIDYEFNDYINCDENVSISGISSDQTSGSPVSQSEDSDPDTEVESEIDQRVPNLSDVTKAISTLKSYFLSKDDYNEELLKSLNQINDRAFKCHFNNSKQSKITDFFSK
jgi:hypothetical protein